MSLQPKYKIVSIKLRYSILSMFLILFGFDAVSNSLLSNKKNFKVTTTPMVRLKMSGLPNYLDETIVYYQLGATDGFDSDFDAYKLFGPNPAPHISQEFSSVLMVINGIAPVVQTFSIHILTTTPTTGNFTITANDFADLPKGTCVYLKDLFTGTIVNILTNAYVFNLSSTTSTSRFILSITHYKLPIVSGLTQPTCHLFNGGKINVTGTANAPWNYIWKDSTGTIVKTVMNSNNSDSLENLSNGTYHVEITSASNSCYLKDTSFSIDQIVLPNMAFTSPDTITASVMQNYEPLNQSINCETYNWNFGDETGNSTDFEPSYSYSESGLYKTKLIGVSTSGCVDSTEKLVKVIDLATHISVELNQNIKLMDMGNNQFKIKLGKYFKDEINISLVDLEGKNILKKSYFSYGSDDMTLNLEAFNTGIYILSIGNKDSILFCSKIFIK